MSSAAIAAGVPDAVSAARKQVETSDFFALCYLMLCQLAYANENDGQKAVQQIKSLLPTMPVPQGTVPGKWQLSWGPQVTNDNSNLMYAAEFLDTQSGLPVFSAVSIRGTDTQAKPSGVIKQIAEDLDADDQVLFPANNQVGSKIAQGTQTGLGVLNGFQDPTTHQSVTQYLQGFVARNPGAPVVVTGHSLGGCQTTVMALDLAAKLPAGTVVVPNSFAAPSAGNDAFIQLYEQTFSFRPRWFNTIDLVPMAFAGLWGIRQLWTQCQRPAPGIVKLLVDALELVLKFRHAHYSQQSPVDSRILTGTCQLARPNMVSNPVLKDALAEVQAILRTAVQTQEDVIRKIPLVGGPLAHGLSFFISDDSFANIDAWFQELLYQHLIMTGYWDEVSKQNGVAQIAAPPSFLQAKAAGQTS